MCVKRLKRGVLLGMTSEILNASDLGANSKLEVSNPPSVLSMGNAAEMSSPLAITVADEQIEGSRFAW